MSKNSETASKLSDLFKPYGVARVTEVPIEKTEYGGGLYRIEFDEDNADENPDQPKRLVLCRVVDGGSVEADEEPAQAESVTLTREALRVYRAACKVAGASPDDSFSTDEVFNLLHEDGGKTPFDYETVRNHLVEMNNLGLFNLEDEEPTQGAKNDSFSRLMERHKEWGLVEEPAQHDGGELETLFDCVVHIELCGDNKAEREKAMKRARQLITEMNERIWNYRDALSDLERGLGSLYTSAIPF